MGRPLLRGLEESGVLDGGRGLGHEELCEIEFFRGERGDIVPAYVEDGAGTILRLHRDADQMITEDAYAWRVNCAGVKMGIVDTLGLPRFGHCASDSLPQRNRPHIERLRPLVGTQDHVRPQKFCIPVHPINPAHVVGQDLVQGLEDAPDHFFEFQCRLNPMRRFQKTFALVGGTLYGLLGLLTRGDLVEEGNHFAGGCLKGVDFEGSGDLVVLVGDLLGLPGFALRGGEPVSFRHLRLHEGRKSLLDGLADELAIVHTEDFVGCRVGSAEYEASVWHQFVHVHTHGGGFHDAAEPRLATRSLQGFLPGLPVQLGLPPGGSYLMGKGRDGRYVGLGQIPCLHHENADDFVFHDKGRNDRFWHAQNPYNLPRELPYTFGQHLSQDVLDIGQEDGSSLPDHLHILLDTFYGYLKVLVPNTDQSLCKPQRFGFVAQIRWIERALLLVCRQNYAGEVELSELAGQRAEYLLRGQGLLHGLGCQDQCLQQLLRPLPFGDFGQDGQRCRSFLPHCLGAAGFNPPDVPSPINDPESVDVGQEDTAQSFLIALLHGRAIIGVDVFKEGA